LSFSSLAPTEKTEHLIYSILPISLATFVASFLITNEPLTILVAVISISSFGSLLLFEFTPEKPLIDEFLRRRTRSRKSLKDALLVFSLMLKAWRSEVIDVTSEKDHLENLARNQVSLAVAGPHIGKKTWRIRASVYLIISIPFLFTALWNYIHRILTSTPIVFNDLPDLVLSFLNVFHDSLAIVIICALGLIIMEVIIRHRKLTSHIDHLARYDYLDRSLAIQRLQYPDYFSDSRSPEGERDEIGLQRISYQTLVAELTPLKDLLLIEDWSGFLNGWDRLYHWVCREIARYADEYWAYYLLKPATNVHKARRVEQRGELVFMDEVVQNAQDEIKRVCYFLSKVDKYQEEGPTIPLPEFGSELNNLLEEICTWSDQPSNLGNILPLLEIAKRYPVIRNSGIATAVMWVLSWLEADNFSWGGLGGVKYLIGLVNDEKVSSETRKLAADISLRAFERGGAGYGWGYFFEGQSLWALWDFAPPERKQAWYNALAHFIEHGKDKVSALIDDERFRKAVQDSPSVRDALIRYSDTRRVEAGSSAGQDTLLKKMNQLLASVRTDAV
jgi:hypothetical protein